MSDAPALNWTDVDVDEHFAFLVETKTGRPLSLSLRTRLVEIFKELPKTADTVFNCSEEALRKGWWSIAKRAGVEALNFPELRHETITRVAETSKLAIIDFQKLSGHCDVRMLLRYSHLFTTYMAQMLDEALAYEDKVTTHRGHRRDKAGVGFNVAEVVNSTPTSMPCP
ncbi:tyrosine-type recombinase/integrase [Duganella dendranthematis]|uniref:Tyrosine-type recombinase/integrase n=1 Tax=Duganella dendranthematis TaxID=2728021 RepID=A0ABX6MBI5_9BURK|nr:tyrosine-type recombinase/integrase [Duganella dendranthematis]QJD91687.1 tyrosine-type recombinase/integrase [Duganella dendranthematis]